MKLAALAAVALPLAWGQAALGYLPNAGVREEVAHDPDRMLLKSEQYALTLDGWLFKTSATPDYYHGNGYWVEARTELAPVRDIILNFKLAAYNGASSYGYTATSFLHSFFGGTFESH